MNARGKCNLPRRIQILSESKEKMKPSILRWMGERKKIRFAMTGEGIIDSVGEGGWLYVTPHQAADIHIETWYRRKTPTQQATLKALEALLFWAHNGIYPPKSEMLAGFHEVILEVTNIMRMDPTCGRRVMVRTSSPLCTSSDMNEFIRTAFVLLMESDVPDHLIEPITDRNPTEIYRAWYTEYSVDEAAYTGIETWEDYLERFPFDEFFAVSRNEAGTGATQQMHIVSRGADKAAIDEPWNWIHGATSVHQRQHQVGWGPILQEFPHIAPKVHRARELAKKKELI
jgi:hypothetical protein